MSKFNTCLDIVLEMEGGYVNNPKDPGGMTNLGVTKRNWEDWLKHPVTEADMRSLTPAKVEAFYRVRYWLPNYCDELPAALALSVFDFAVNAGDGREIHMLQELVGAAPDGVIGPQTRALILTWLGSRTVAEAVHSHVNARRSYYRACKNFPTFGRGWLNRCDAIEAAAKKLIP